jgi:hypothetical protein
MTFEEKGYVVVKNVLPQEFLNVICQSLLFSFKNTLSGDDGGGYETKKDLGFFFEKYADCLTETLLLKCKSKIEESINKTLVPTYSSSRVFIPATMLGGVISKNPSDEISVLFSAGQNFSYDHWPLYVNGEKIYMELGDALVYKGLNTKVWRNGLKNLPEKSYHVDFTLHYIDGYGKYFPEYKNDKREDLGMNHVDKKKGK